MKRIIELLVNDETYEVAVEPEEKVKEVLDPAVLDIPENIHSDLVEAVEMGSFSKVEEILASLESNAESNVEQAWLEEAERTEALAIIDSPIALETGIKALEKASLHAVVTECTSPKTDSVETAATCRNT